MSITQWNCAHPETAATELIEDAYKRRCMRELVILCRTVLRRLLPPELHPPDEEMGRPSFVKRRQTDRG